MNILIPMAGAGQRFAEEGYVIHKPAISTVDRETGVEHPMVVCATMDLPGVEQAGENVIYIDRIFHKQDGVESEIQQYYPKAKFITVENLTEGQASTCLLAKDLINNDEPLLIAGCDNGMDFDHDLFDKITNEADVLVFTYRNNESVLENPNAYGWVKVDDNQKIVELSIKKAISTTPMNDHAIVATFWFKKGSIFVDAAEKMIRKNDRINNEFYVDQAIKYVLDLDYDVRVFEIDRYIGWGTPKDYENYTSTINYWREFICSSGFLGEK